MRLFAEIIPQLKSIAKSEDVNALSFKRTAVCFELQGMPDSSGVNSLCTRLSMLCGLRTCMKAGGEVPADLPTNIYTITKKRGVYPTKRLVHFFWC